MKFILLILLSSIFLIQLVESTTQVKTDNKDSVLQHLSSLGFGENKNGNRGLQRMLDKDNALKESIKYFD